MEKLMLELNKLFENRVREIVLEVMKEELDRKFFRYKWIKFEDLIEKPRKKSIRKNHRSGASSKKV